MYSVETEKLVEYYYYSANGATESAKIVTNGIKSIFAKIFPNVKVEDEEDEEECSAKNPLLIDLIVNNIMKYLPMRDLCSCRQVCKLWNIEAGAYFRKQQRIIFYPESIEKMANFTAFMETQETKSKKLPPFTTFCFTAQYPSTQFPKHMMEDFVTVYGQYVKTLEIFYPDDGDLSGEDFKTFFISGMPNLESIHFVNLPQSLTQSSFLNSNDNLQLGATIHLKIDRSWQIETSWKENFIQDLLRLMPNLIDYEVWTWNSTVDEHSKPYLMSLSPVQRENLRILRPGSIGEDLGQSLVQLGLQLKKLYLPVLNGDVSAKTLEALLANQRNTLEEFQLNCSSVQDSRFIQFPRLPKLKTLHIIITYPWNNDYTVFSPPIDYKNQFPSLDTLKLELAIYIDLGFINYFFPPNNTICVTLRELDISFNGFRDEKFIGCVSQIFPNLRRLRLDGYGSKIFSSICFNMQNLEELILYLIYGFNVDDQLTGIPKDICAKMRKSYKCGYNEFKIDQVQHLPSLSSLTKLHTVAIKQKDHQAKFWPESQCITDVTAYFAFANIKQLRHLQVQSVKFSDDCQNYLAESLQDCWLDFL